MNKIASGAEGDIYVLQGKKILKHRKVNSDDKEFRIQQILYQHFPEFIIRPIDQFRTLNGKPIFLMDFLNASNFAVFPNISKKLVCQVLKNLEKIHKKFPNFRHNDLHLGNIMITKDEKTYINDFGKATISDIPTVNHLNMYPDYGIVPNNDQRYDYHLFINSVFGLGIEEINKIILEHIPPEYLGFTSRYIHNYRLRPDVEHTDLPSRTKLVKIFCDISKK